MRFSTLIAALAAVTLPAAVSAQATGVDHQIVVGMNGTLTYTPANITAAMGDTVTFVFVAGNHTVTQSTFPMPCMYTQNATAGTEGFQSGFQPVSANQSLVPSVTMMVNTTTPIWFYCQQGRHCEEGMVGAINAVETSAKSYEAFKAAAMAAGTGASSATGSASGSGMMAAPTQTPASGALANTVKSAGAMLIAVGAVASILL